MVWVRWCVPQEDLDQERELAQLEGRCPIEAARAYIARERHFYDFITSIDTVSELGIAVAPMPVYHEARRSPESVERRRSYTRDWWRRNGAEYRRRRQEASRATLRIPPVAEP
jgi:hypothetical protein